MVNQDFDVLRNWMFGSLASLLDGKSPNPNLKILTPHFETSTPDLEISTPSKIFDKNEIAP